MRTILLTYRATSYALSNFMISLANYPLPTFPYCERLYPLSLAPFFPANDLNELAAVLLLARRLHYLSLSRWMVVNGKAAL
jgi:hypothetical protein